MSLQAFGIAVALSLVSCSFIAVKRLPSPHEAGDEEDCTASLAYPFVDASITVLSGLLAVSLWAATTDDDSDTTSNALKTASITSGGVSLLHLSSAVWGTWFINRCKRAQNKAGLNRPKDPVVDRPQPGFLGGPCRKDGSCEAELMCDPPMNTCIRIVDNGEDI